ncbi:MAG: orotate phosphoribosyltransferase [Planctomycetes bacterium]|nr:orotate phosphoribosyltransferase [Planctomycetota bacterium]
MDILNKTPEEIRNRIIELLAHKSYCYKQEGFKLSSGGMSNEYINSKKFTNDPECLRLAASYIWDIIKDEKIDAIGGMALGAVHIETAVSLYILDYQEINIPTFTVRAAPKTHGTMNKVEGTLESDSNVVVLDDVATTGGSILDVIEAVESLGCNVAKVIAIVDREQGAEEKLKHKGYDYKFICTLSEIRREYKRAQKSTKNVSI